METQMEALNSAMESAFREAFPDDSRRFVFGDGPWQRPRVLLIGEAPGKDEEAQGRPFVGKAGKNLDAFLEAIALDRSALRISNTVKVRPSKVSAKGTVSNRPPDREELSFFIPWLKKEILLTQPEVIVTLGNTPLQALLGKDAVIGSFHGKLIPYALENAAFRLFPLYHPASIIYNRSLAAVYQADLALLKAALENL